MKPTAEIVAGSQIDSAIYLLAFAGDPISTHTLTLSASKVIYDQSANQAEVSNSRNWFSESLQQMDPSARANSAARLLEQHYNFFKHGKDSYDAFPDDFSLSLVERILFFTSNDFAFLYEYMSTNMQIYALWYLSRHRDDLGEASPKLRALTEHDGRERIPNLHAMSDDDSKQVLRDLLMNTELRSRMDALAEHRRALKMAATAVPPPAGSPSPGA
jgi:hypothetical protein